MNKVDVNTAVLGAVHWNEELARVSISGDERFLWIMVDKSTGEIQKISKRLYSIQNTIQGHLCVKGSLMSREFELKLAAECEDNWPQEIFSVVKESLRAFGRLDLS